MPEEKEVCEKCGSQEVARIRWVNVNTLKPYLGIDPSDGIEWCFGGCAAQTTIVGENDFKKEG